MRQADDYTVLTRIEKLREENPEFFRFESLKEEEARQEKKAIEEVEGRPLMEWSPTTCTYEFIWEDLCQICAQAVYNRLQTINKDGTPGLERDDLLQEARVKAIELLNTDRDVFRVSVMRHLWHYVRYCTTGVFVADEEDVENVRG